MHFIRYIGLLLIFVATQVICNNDSQRSIFVEDDDFELVKILPNGQEEVCDILPNRELKIPDHVTLCIDNTYGEQNIIVEKKGTKKAVSIELAPEESAIIVEAETGETGLLQKNYNDSYTLHAIGDSTNCKNENNSPSNQTNPQLNDSLHNPKEKTEKWESVTNKLNTTVTVLPPACKTRTFTPVITPDHHNDLPDQPDDPIYNTPIADDIPTPSLGHNNWPSWTLLYGGCIGLGLLFFYYLAKNAMAGDLYLHRDDLWSSWKSEEPYSVLLMIEPQHLASELIHDITIFYYQETNPIPHFLRDIQEEYETISSWIHFRNLVYRFWLPLGEEFDMAENRLMLLEHMRKAVYYWRAQQLSKK